MRNTNRAKDSWLDIGRVDDRADRDHLGAAAGAASFLRFGSIWIIVFVVALLGVGGSAFGQYGSFTVTPMKVEAQVTPGREIVTVMNIQSLDPNATHTIDLTLVELTQAQSGEWMIVDPNLVGDPNAPEYKFDLKRLSSCRSWVRLSENSVTLEPSQFAPVQVNIRAPRREKGFHTAGILATVRPRPDMRGLSVSVRFLVPIVVEIETHPMAPKIEATDVALRFVPASGGGPATTLVTVGVLNNRAAR